MSKKLAYERYHWFHGQVMKGHYPNARTLAENFEISAKQAQRDIDFMKDRLGAPLKYIAEKRGYEYEKSYELPPVWFSADELMAFCIASRLASAIPDGKLKRGIKEFLEKLLSMRTIERAKWSVANIEEFISIKNIEYYRVKEEVFRIILNALFKRNSLRITYRTPHKGEQTERTVLPLHLFCYMGSWHMIAYCDLRKNLRDFALSRIRDIRQIEEKIELPAGLPSVKDYIRRNFGVMVGDDSKDVVLRFAPDIASWVSEQIWHEGQEATFDEKGGLILKFQVTGFEEVLREILKYGSQVEVVSPPELKAIVVLEIKKMAKLYR